MLHGHTMLLASVQPTVTGSTRLLLLALQDLMAQRAMATTAHSHCCWPGLCQIQESAEEFINGLRLHITCNSVLHSSWRPQQQVTVNVDQATVCWV